VFENAKWPAENVLGAESEGVEHPDERTRYERSVARRRLVGIMQTCMEVVVALYPRPKQFGQPIGDFQLIAGPRWRTVCHAVGLERLCICGGGACDHEAPTTRKEEAGAIL